jgi:hypothetical protein
MTSNDNPTPNPARSQIMDLALDLQLEHRNVGEPSYRKIARQLDHRVSAATICRAFQGERLPSWEVVEAILTVFNIPASEIDGIWRPRWVRIKNAIDPIPVTNDDMPTNIVEITQPPAGVECTICGSWVTNMDLHTAWHDTYIPQPRTAPGRTLRPTRRDRIGQLAG